MWHSHGEEYVHCRRQTDGQMPDDKQMPHEHTRLSIEQALSVKNMRIRQKLKNHHFLID